MKLFIERLAERVISLLEDFNFSSEKFHQINCLSGACGPDARVLILSGDLLDVLLVHEQNSLLFVRSCCMDL